MLNVDLSTLRAPELRRLLDSTRQRGQAQLSYEILQEMAARRERDEGRGFFPPRRGSEPHEISLDFGDPLDRDEDEVDPIQVGEALVDEEPADAAPVVANAVHHEASYPSFQGSAGVAHEASYEPAYDEADEPTFLHSDDGAARGGRKPPPDRPPRGFPVPRRWLWVTVGVAIGLFVGLAVGGWADSVSREPKMPKSNAPDTAQVAAATPAPAALAPAAPAAETPAPTSSAPIADDSITPATTPLNALPPQPVTSAAPTPAPALAPSAAVARPPAPAAPAVPSSPTPAATPALAAKAKTPPTQAAAKTAPDTLDSIEADLGKPATSTQAATKLASAGPAKAPAAVGAAPAKGPCAGQPTPADKTICETPRLQQLQRDLRQAYADALDAHQDRDLLRQHQLAWRDNRSTVTDPDKLARLYEERIRKLNAAAEEARSAPH